MPHVLELRDGRKLDYHISGTFDGFPLVFMHGTPASYIVDPELAFGCEKKGIRLISVSRAGYGGSTRNRGRTVVDSVADIHTLLQHLGVRECVVYGLSGGGPHALAAAARLPGCLAALCVCCLAPYPAEGMDFFDGFDEHAIKQYKAAIEGEKPITASLEAQRPSLLAADLDGIIQAFSHVLPEVDSTAMLEGRSSGEHFVQTWREALKNGVGGCVDDNLAFTRPWGFELSEIKVPVIVYHGDLDKMIPFAHGKWLVEHLPQDQVRSRLLEGEGHISVARNYVAQMLGEVLVAAGR